MAMGRARAMKARAKDRARARLMVKVKVKSLWRERRLARRAEARARMQANADEEDLAQVIADWVAAGEQRASAATECGLRTSVTGYTPEPSGPGRRANTEKNDWLHSMVALVFKLGVRPSWRVGSRMFREVQELIREEPTQSGSCGQYVESSGRRRRNTRCPYSTDHPCAPAAGDRDSGRPRRTDGVGGWNE